MKQLKSILLFTVFAVGCGGNGGGGNSQVIARTCNNIGLPFKVIGGFECGELEKSPVVRVALLRATPQRIIPQPVCTGTMISVDDVLTAAHCLENIPQNTVGIGVLVGDAGEARYVDGINFSVMPGYGVQGSRLVNDAAILTLSESPALPVVPIMFSRAVQTGDIGQVYGYGKREEGAETVEEDLFYNLVAGEMEIRTVTPQHLFVTYDGYGTNVCNGDSGGPLIVNVNNVPNLAGVVSQGSSAGCRSLDVTTFTNVTSFEALDWIASVVPDAAAY